MLSGDNGILQKATDVKQNSERTQIEERIKLAYHSALTGGQGSYTKNSLEEELIEEFGNDFEEVDDSDNTNWILKAKGQSVTIPAGKKGEFIPLTSDELNGQLLGTEVEYSGYTANYTGGWRVFYATDEETFLISTDTIPLGSDLPTVSKTGKEYTGSFDVAKSIYGRTWNKKWVIDKLNQSIDEGTSSVQSQGRHKCAAYLCDTENWTDYLTGSANYAVGGPTIELFVNAWKKRPGGSESITAYSVNEYGYSQIRDIEVTSDILALEGTTKGLYNNGDNYWIASPDSDSSGPVSQWSVLDFSTSYRTY